MCISGTEPSSVILSQTSKIEKVPSGIQGEKSSKDDKLEKSGLNNWSTSKSQKRGVQGVRKGKRSLLPVANALWKPLIIR